METTTQKKIWVRPQIEVVDLEHDEDVLRTCRTPSNGSKNSNCPTAQCLST